MLLMFLQKNLYVIQSQDSVWLGQKMFGFVNMIFFTTVSLKFVAKITFMACKVRVVSPA